MKNETITVDGRTLDLTLVKAAGTLGVSTDEVDYRVVSQQKSGLLSLFLPKKIQIEAWVRRAPSASGGNRGERSDRGERSERGGRQGGRGGGRHSRSDSRGSGRRFGGSSHTQPRHQSTRAPRHDSTPDVPIVPLTEAEVQQLTIELQAFCRGICEAMTGEVTEVSCRMDSAVERLIFDIGSDYFESQVGKNGKLAEAIEHLLRKKPRHIRSELPFRIFVDANGIRTKRETELTTLAQDMATKVSSNGKPVVLDYRNPYDRKVIHLALERDQRVYTKSIGVGSDRRLMIMPAGVDSDDVAADSVNAEAL